MLKSQNADAFPITVDPTIVVGAAWKYDYYSGGGGCGTCDQRVGNALPGGSDGYWRSIVNVPYEGLIDQDYRVLSASIGLTCTACSPDVAGVDAWWATGYSYAQADPNSGDRYIGSTDLGGPGASATIDATSMFQDWVNVDRLAEGVRGSAIGFSGEEASGWYTYKQFTTLVTMVYDHPPGWVDTPTAPTTNGTVLTSTTPTLSVAGVTDPEGLPVRYYFRLSTGTDGESGQVINSGWLAGGATSWSVPSGSLRDGVTYYWHVYSWEDSTYAGIQTIRKPINFGSTPGQWIVWNFKVDLRLGSGGPSPTDRAGPGTVNLATGNLSVTAGTPSLSTIGGNIGLSFTYNSQQPSDQGLLGTYYWDANGNTGFDDGGPVLTRTDPQVLFDWGAGTPSPALPADHFNVKWTGKITLSEAGTWALGRTGDDGVNIWIDGTYLEHSSWSDGLRVFPVWGGPVTAGVHDIRVEYYEKTGNASIGLWAQSPSGVQQPVPASWLSTGVKNLPPKWTLAGGDIDEVYSSARIQDGSVTLIGGDGSSYEYKKTATGGFTPPAGQDDVLAMSADGSLVVQADDGYTYTFSSAGQLRSVTSGADDRKPAAPKYLYGGSPVHLTAIRDGALAADTANPIVHDMQLFYAGDTECQGLTPPSGLARATDAGLLCLVRFWDDSETRLWYTPTSGSQNLARVENPGGAVTDFGYDSNGDMTQIRDSLAADAVAAGVRADNDTTRTIVGYTGGKVTSVTMPEPTAGAARPAKTYNYTSGATDVLVAGLTMPQGYYRHVTYDASSRLLTNTDATAKTTTSTWDDQDHLLSTIDPAGLKSASIYDYAQRVTDTYGPAPTDSYSGNVGDGTVPHTHTAHDETLQTLGAAYWNNKDLSGPPMFHGTGVGSGNGGNIHVDWGGGGPGASIPADGWGLRLTGDVTMDTTGTYAFRAFAAGGVRIYVDDILLVDRWTDPGSANTVTSDGQFLNTVAGSKHRLRVDFFDNSGDAKLFLWWTPPGSAADEVPGTAMTPRYGLATTTTDADGKTTTTSYTDAAAGIGPELGLATKTTVDPGGLDLQTTTTYEAPNSGGFLRRLHTTMPSDGGTGATQTNDVYYAVGDEVADPCTTSSAVNQGAREKYDQSATPGGSADPAIQREYVYDAAGRTVATRVAAEPWTCTSYDTRGRPTTVSYPAYGSQPARMVTNNYAVGGNPLVTSASDPAGTITTTVDLVGRVVSYTDVWAKTTTTTYDQPGLVTGTTTTGQFPMSYEYDPAGRLEVEKVLTMPIADPSYDSAGRLSVVAYPSGTGYAGNGTAGVFGYDTLGRLNAQTWLGPGFSLITSDNVTRTTGGDVIDQSIDGTDAYTTGDNFAYDNAGRLTDAHVPGHTITYGFGATTGCTNNNAGRNTNRTTMVDNGTTTGYCYDNADRLNTSTDPTVGTIAYDAHGNATTIFGETHGYDGADRHLTTTTPAAAVTYTRDATDRIVARTATVQPTLRASTTATTGSATATSLSVNRPTGTQTGDLLLTAVTLSGTGAITAPTGWTVLQDRATGSAIRTAVYQHVAAASDPTSWTFTWATAKRATASMLAYQDVDTTSPIETSAQAGSTTAVTNHNAPSVTSSGPQRRLINIYGILASTTLAPPTGSTERADLNTTGSSAVTLEIADQAKDQSGATGTQTATSAGSGKNALISVLLRPRVETGRYGFTGNGDTPDLTLDTSNNIIENTFSLPGGAILTSRPTGNIWSYPNIHGDNAATTDNTGIKQGATTCYDPYGQPVQADLPDNADGAFDSDWLGRYQRGVEHTSGLQLILEMGSRQYSPRLGRFLEVDPIEGGSCGDYDYVCADPINGRDLSGNLFLLAALSKLIHRVRRLVAAAVLWRRFQCGCANSIYHSSAMNALLAIQPSWADRLAYNARRKRLREEAVQRYMGPSRLFILPRPPSRHVERQIYTTLCGGSFYPGIITALPFRAGMWIVGSTGGCIVADWMTTTDPAG